MISLSGRGSFTDRVSQRASLDVGQKERESMAPRPAPPVTVVQLSLYSARDSTVSRLRKRGEYRAIKKHPDNKIGFVVKKPHMRKN